MLCTIKGYLYGVICGKLPLVDAVPDAEVFAVPSTSDKAHAGGLDQPGMVDLKPVVRTISEEECKRLLSSTHVMRAKTDDSGMFCMVDRTYKGGLIDLYACISAVPSTLKGHAKVAFDPRVCLFLGTYLPVRGEDGWNLVAYIPSGAWCAIKKKADLWTIAGKLTACKSGTPIGGARVMAYDTDWVQDDYLGVSTTNAAGIFRIDYMGAMYRKAPIIDIELFGGPDVYFRVEDTLGTVLLAENRWKGRSAGRSDSGPCLCVALCADIEDTTEVDGLVTAWTGIGTHFTIPDAAVLNDFDADGYAGPQKYAFFSSMRMTGSAPVLSPASRPVEYRFLVSDTTTPNGGAPPADASFSRVVGLGADAVLFTSIKVGQMIRYSPLRIKDIYAKLVDLDTEGWLDVDRAIRRTFIEDTTGLTPADIPDFAWVDSDGLLGINTAPLTSVGLTKVAIRFQIREVVDKLTNSYNDMPGTGTTLNSIMIDNTAITHSVSVHTAGGECDPLTTVPAVKYSVDHPHLMSVTLNVRSNDSAYNVNLTDTNLPLSGNTNPAITHVGNSGLSIPSAGLKTCTYLVTLSDLRRLHTGDSTATWQDIHTTFYYVKP